jgi:SAM-dependent methyltransferase
MKRARRTVVQPGVNVDNVMTGGGLMMDTTMNWKGRLGPMLIRLSDTTFRPSTISTLIADALSIDTGDVVIDVGCGSGILSIIAAKLGAAKVFAVDKSPDVVVVGTANAEAHGVADRITFYQGDLFDPIPDDVQADVIIGDVSGVPDSLADDSGWFPTKGGGGPRGSELPIRMLEEAKRRLRPMGRLFLPTGTLQDEATILTRARSLYGKIRSLADRPIPLPGQLASSPVLMDLIERKVVSVTSRGSRFLWNARVWELSATAG